MKNRYFILTALFCIGASAHAGIVRVPDGCYKGIGIWSDSQGNVGTAKVIYKATGTQGYNQADFGGSRFYAGSFEYQFSNDNNYAVVVKYQGSDVVIGNGACAGTLCHTVDTIVTPFAGTEKADEIASFQNSNRLRRMGTLTNAATGVTTIYEAELDRKNANKCKFKPDGTIEF